MTVEQSPLEQFYNTNQGEAKMQALLHLKEVTGIDDSQVLTQALEASKTEAGIYDLNQAVSMVMDEKPKPKKVSAPELMQETMTPKVPSQTDTTDAVIDLTNETGTEKEDDLQKAIALSLQEHHAVLGSQVTMEEQDISRVLEASLADTKAVGTKRKRGEVWQDPINPHDRERKDDWPIGLKNVGNTCWFAAVIQSLFHLPVFLHLVLCFSPNPEWTSNMGIKERRNIIFMQELRKLFSLMLASRRKYVDPSQALEIWRETFHNSTDNQQDVSEFSHKLIESLEEAYKIDIASQPNSSLKENIQNPVTSLFYGTHKCEGQNEGHTFSNEYKFGQYPLQVKGFNDIHESLESAAAQEIESSNAMSKSGQEAWLTQLPPVLLFDLSRFNFNQQLGKPEKIHDKLHFPDIIFMDRYMETNKSVTRQKREQVRKLKENRSKLHSRLQKYLNYGSVPKRVPLQDILECALEFVESGVVESSTCNSQDVEMSSPASSLAGSTPSKENEDSTISKPSIKRENPSTMCSTPRCTTQFSERVIPSSVPTPRYISEEELNIFQSCLKRWRTEVENDVKELQDQVAKADQAIREIYNEQVLQKHPYKLHAVLVHEGQAASGHYWSYVFCQKREKWLKFNDVRVTEATWTELQKDSVGGESNASAYCLVYINHHLPMKQVSPRGFEDLPEDLQRYVGGDNELFDSEIRQWDLDQSFKKDAGTMTSDSTLAGGLAFKPIVDKGASSGASGFTYTSAPSFSQVPPSLHMEHALICLKDTKARVEQMAKKYQEQKPIQDIVEEFISMELAKINRIVVMEADLMEDVRLLNFCIYLIKNKVVQDTFLRLALLEQFAPLQMISYCNSFGKTLRIFALDERQKILKELDKKQQKSYEDWHRRYQIFRRAVLHFVTGIDKYQNKCYEEALPYFLEAHILNSKIVTNPINQSSGLNQKVLAHYKRKCLIHLNESVARQFQSKDSVDDVLTLMNSYIIPGMTYLNARDSNSSVSQDLASGIGDHLVSPQRVDSLPLLEGGEETLHDLPSPDSQAAIQIRDCWFSMLGGDIPSEKQTKLQEFLLRLAEIETNPSNNAGFMKPTFAYRISDLGIKYKHTMKLLQDSEDYQEILQFCGSPLALN